MEERKLGPVELRFAELIWENAPISSGELVKLCARELEWKKSTTYTVLKKLCEQGLFQNQGGTVTVLVSRQDYQARQRRFSLYGGHWASFSFPIAANRASTAALGGGGAAACGSLLSGKSMEPASKR